MLLVAALQLPHTKTDEDGHHGQGKGAEPAPAPPRLNRRHFGARSISRPSAALWWNCSAIRSDFIERSGNSVVARISGSHSTAWTQNGGWDFGYTKSRPAT